jgi:hypothetical protein
MEHVTWFQNHNLQLEVPDLYLTSLTQNVLGNFYTMNRHVWLGCSLTSVQNNSVFQQQLHHCA